MKMKNFFSRLGILGWLFIATTVIAAGVGGSIYTIGTDTTTGDVEIRLRQGRIKWDDTANVLQFSNDSGGVYKNIGAGSSGSGGIDNLDNPGFEDGIAVNWSCTGATCTEETTDPLSGDRSLIFTPIAQDNELKSDLKAIPVGLQGTACEARVFYTGGDENLTAQVIDANDLVLGETVLSAHSIAGFESVFFLCPTAADILGDADKGELSLRVYNEQVTVAAAATFDDMRLGSLVGLVEYASPDVEGFIIDEGTIVSQSSDIIDSVTFVNSTTATDVTFKAGVLTQIPVIVSVVDVESIGSVGKRTISIYDVTTSGFTFVIENSTPNITQGFPAHFALIKQGADAKQSVQVYKSTPKVSDNIPFFTANIDSNGVVSDEIVDWINGDCTNANPNVCTFNSDIFTVAPLCFANSVSSASRFTTIELAPTASNVSVQAYDDGGSNSATDKVLVCFKGFGDFKLPLVQPVFANQVSTKVEKGLLVNTCQVDSTGTPVVNDIGGMCSSWVDSLTDLGVGQTRLNLISGVYSGTNFTCTTSLNHTFLTSVFCGAKAVDTANEVEVGCNDQTGAAADRGFTITCWGVK